MRERERELANMLDAYATLKQIFNGSDRHWELCFLIEETLRSLGHKLPYGNVWN